MKNKNKRVASEAWLNRNGIIIIFAILFIVALLAHLLVVPMVASIITLLLFAPLVLDLFLNKNTSIGDEYAVKPIKDQQIRGSYLKLHTSLDNEEERQKEPIVSNKKLEPPDRYLAVDDDEPYVAAAKQKRSTIINKKSEPMDGYLACDEDESYLSADDELYDNGAGLWPPGYV